MPRYRPWIGCSMVGASIVAEFILGRTGSIFLATLFLTTYWATR